jgi:hypothetical protein
VAGFKGLFRISTIPVDNDVENAPLDSPERCAGARFNKLPIPRAKTRTRKIKHLAHHFAANRDLGTPSKKEIFVHNRRARDAARRPHQYNFYIEF